jgi:hypothetical protein
MRLHTDEFTFNTHSKIKGMPEKSRTTKLDFETKILHFIISIQHHHREISFPNQFVRRMTGSTTGVLGSSNGTPSPAHMQRL